MKLSILIPCLNEVVTIERTVKAAQKAGKKYIGKDFEIIIADNGSSDGTLEKLSKIKNTRVFKKRGKLFLTIPFIWGEHEAPYDFRRYSTYGIKRLVNTVGLSIIKPSKLEIGFDAIESLVSSEITNFGINIDKRKRSCVYNYVETFVYIIWLILLRLRKRMYKFDMKYINNLVIAEKN